MIRCGIALYKMRDSAAPVHKHLCNHANDVLPTKDDKKIRLDEGDLSHALATVSESEISTTNGLGPIGHSVEAR